MYCFVQCIVRTRAKWLQFLFFDADSFFTVHRTSIERPFEGTASLIVKFNLHSSEIEFDGNSHSSSRAVDIWLQYGMMCVIIAL